MLHSRTTPARRTLAAVVAPMALATLLVGCGQEDDGSASAPSTTPGQTAAPPAQGGAGHGGGGLASDARHIQVAARSFAFEPNQITAKAGETLAIVLAAEGSQHRFKIDELNADVSAGAGQTGYGQFPAKAPGRYTFYCSVAGHREAGMEGVLAVEA